MGDNFVNIGHTYTVCLNVKQGLLLRHTKYVENNININTHLNLGSGSHFLKSNCSAYNKEYYFIFFLFYMSDKYYL